MARLLFQALLLLFALPCVAADYPDVIPGLRLEFPRDEGAHPDFRTEWWYVTGWLKGEDGSDLGFQVTFFRVRPQPGEDNPSRFAPRQILFAHAALADPAVGRLRHGERAARAGFGLAEARQGATDVEIDDWSLRQEGGGYHARISGEDFALDLALTPTQAVLIEGDQGYSRKAQEGKHASYYYSFPQLAARGSVARAGRRLAVTGRAWLDHEWSSELMSPQAVGWDWIGLNLDDGTALMAFRMRDASGATLWAGGTLRRRDGTARVLGPQEVEFVARRRWRSPRTGTDYPIGMEVRVPGVRLELRALIDDQELDARSSTGTLYWEGAVRALEAGREVGRGYLELTGYWRKLELK